MDDVSSSTNADAPGALLLTGTDGDTTARSSSQVQAGLSRRWLVAGGLVICALAWVLFARPSNETPIEGTSEAAATDDAEDDTGDTSSDTDTEDEDEDEDENDTDTDIDIDDEDDSVTELDTDAESDSGPLDESDTEDQSGSSDEPSSAGPILGEETGLGLIVGGLDFAPLELVNLDTGETHDLGPRGSPVAMIENSLVLNSTDGALRILDLSVPDGETIDIEQNGQNWPTVLGVADGLFWVAFAGEEDDSILRAFDSNGEEQGTLDLGVDPFLFGWSGDRSLIYHSGGGIYESDGDGYRRVSPGFLRASGETVALVSECDDAMACELHWYDRATWDRLPFPAPQDTALTARAFVAGDDRWLVETSWMTQTTRVTDIETGDVVRESRSNSFPFAPVAISDDGRWLLDPMGSIETFIDLETGAEWEYQSPSGSTPTAIFVNLDDTIYGA